MDLKDKVRVLINKIGLFTPEEVELITDKTIIDTFEKGTFLLKEGQIATKCYMVVEGCVREFVVKNEEEKSTAFFLEGDTFTPRSNYDEPSEYYWECIEDSVITISDKNYEEELRALIPRLDTVFQEMAIQKINLAKAEWNQFVSSSPEERYLNLKKTKPFLFDRVPHHQIASYIGMTPQSLSRIRKRLSQKK